MLPLAIPLASAAISAGQAIGGMFSRRKARKEFEAAEMPDFFESSAYRQAQTNANLAGRYADQGLPEESFRFQEDMIGRSGAAALASQGSLRGLTQAGGVATSLSDQYRSLAGMDANARIAQQGQYLRSLGMLQQAKQQGFDYQMGDFINQQAARLGRMSAGADTMNAGLKGLGTAGAMLIDSGMLGLNPGGNSTTAPQASAGTPDTFALNQNPFSRSYINPAFATITSPTNLWD